MIGRDPNGRQFLSTKFVCNNYGIDAGFMKESRTREALRVLLRETLRAPRQWAVPAGRGCNTFGWPPIKAWHQFLPSSARELLEYIPMSFPF